LARGFETEKSFALTAVQIPPPHQRHYKAFSAFSGAKWYENGSNDFIETTQWFRHTTD